MFPFHTQTPHFFMCDLLNERDSLQPPTTPIPAPSFTYGNQAVRVTMKRVIRLLYSSPMIIDICRAFGSGAVITCFYDLVLS